MEPKLTSLNGMNIIGLEIRTTNQNEMDPSTAKIASLWNRFFTENCAEKIPNKLNPGILLGVYTNYESDHTGEYSLIIGSETTGLETVPDGMTGHAIPSGNYLVFTAKGKLPETLVNAWGFIWSYFTDDCPYQRIYTSDFELYKAEDEVDIYIAVK